MVGGEGLADRRVGRRVRDRERGLQQVPGLAGGHRPEGAAPVAVPAPLQQRVHLRGDPAVGQHPGGVVVDHEDQGVRLGPAVTEQAHGLVAIPERVRVHGAVPGRHGAHVLGPARPLDPALDQDERGAFRRGGLPERAQARDAGKQRQRRRALVLAGVRDQPLPDHFLQVGVAGAGARLALSPPGAEQFADHQLGVERAAHREQLPRGPEHFREESIRWRSWKRGRPGDPAVTGPAASGRSIPAAALRTHPPSFPDLRRHGPVPRYPPVISRRAPADLPSAGPASAAGPAPPPGLPGRRRPPVTGCRPGPSGAAAPVCGTRSGHPGARSGLG